jgi:hypothetical protein
VAREIPARIACGPQAGFDHLGVSGAWRDAPGTNGTRDARTERDGRRTRGTGIGLGPARDRTRAREVRAPGTRARAVWAPCTRAQGVRARQALDRPRLGWMPPRAGSLFLASGVDALSGGWGPQSLRQSSPGGDLSGREGFRTRLRNSLCEAPIPPGGLRTRRVRSLGGPRWPHEASSAAGPEEQRRSRTPQPRRGLSERLRPPRPAKASKRRFSPSGAQARSPAARSGSCR